MKKTKNIAFIVATLEYEIANSCYNPNSYDGYTGDEGCEFRYPVWIYRNGEEERYRGRISNLKPEEIDTIKYKFGSNHLFIGEGLIKVLECLEKRYQIDFDKMEEQFRKERIKEYKE